MLDKILLASLLISSVLAADATRNVVYSGLVRCGGCMMFTFDNGYIFQMNGGHEPSTGLAVYNRDARLAYQANLTAPDGTPAYLHQKGVVADTDGTVILTMWFGGYGGFAPVKGGGIIFLDPNGRQTQFIDTGRFMPATLCFAPDHSLWTVGTQFGPQDGDVRGADYPLVRHYSRDGKLIGAFLARASFPPGLTPGSSGISWMRAANDRIGIMTYPGQVSDTPTWVELDFQGKEIGRWKLGGSDLGNGGWAFTSDAQLYARPRIGSSQRRLLSVFDRSTSSWHAIGSGSDPGVQLMGADGTDLVFLGSYNNPVQLVWFSPR